MTSHEFKLVLNRAYTQVPLHRDIWQYIVKFVYMPLKPKNVALCLQIRMGFNIRNMKMKHIRRIKKIPREQINNILKFLHLFYQQYMSRIRMNMLMLDYTRKIFQMRECFVKVWDIESRRPKYLVYENYPQTIEDNEKYYNRKWEIKCPQVPVDLQRITSGFGRL